MNEVNEVETVEATIVDKGGTPPVQPQPEAQDGFSGKPGDLQKDLALLASQQQPQQDAQTQEVQPEPAPVAQEPAQPATATETPVPDKFKNPDGTVNLDRVAKSKEAAIAEYQRIERELRQKQNELARVGQAPAQQQPPQTQPQPVMPVQLTPFERQAAIDILTDAQALGIQMTEAQAILQARADIRMAEAKHRTDLSITEDIRQRLESQEREKELSAIAEVDSWVFSPEGMRTLAEIRQSRPHVNAAREPWKAAYREHLADEAMKQRVGGKVQNPNPTAPAAKAPPTPVGVAPRAVVKPNTPDMTAMTADQITEYVKTLDPKAEAAFWKARGLRF